MRKTILYCLAESPIGLSIDPDMRGKGGEKSAMLQKGGEKDGKRGLRQDKLGKGE